jgi:hypothetical protein
MSDIKVGDLVMVVRGSSCCDLSHFMGLPFAVHSVQFVQSECVRCGAVKETNLVCRDQYYGFEESTVIKIDPPAMPESTEREKELVLR